MPDTRRRAALLGGVLLIAVAIIIGWRVRSDVGRASRPATSASAGVLASASPSSTVAGPSSGAGGVPTALPTADVQALEERLSAVRSGDVAPALALSVRQAYLSSGGSLLPGGSHVAIVPGTEHFVSPALGSVEADVTGPEPGRYILLLVSEGGQWHVYGTRRA